MGFALHRRRVHSAASSVIVATMLLGCGHPSQTPARAPWAPIASPSPGEIAPDTTVVLQDQQGPSQDTIGGTAFTVINAPSFTVMDTLSQSEAYWRVLPRVRSIRHVGDIDNDVLVAVEHSMGLFTGGYTMRVRRTWGNAGKHTIQFWVDTRFPRDVADAWGYFEFSPLDGERTMLTYRVRISLQPGIVKLLFEDRIQKAVMSVPDRARGLVEELYEQAQAGSPTRQNVPLGG